MRTLSLRRTKQALGHYDRSRDAFIADPNEQTAQALDDAEKAIGEAFAQDTSDRNDPETARRQVVCGWLRYMVEKYP